MKDKSDFDAYLKKKHHSFEHFEASGNCEEVISVYGMSNTFIIIMCLKRSKHFNLTTVKIW